MARRVPAAPPCPRCGSRETEPLRNFGRPVAGRFKCFACERRRPCAGPCWFGPNNPPDAGGTGEPDAAPDEPELLRVARELGSAVVGLVVSHGGHAITLTRRRHGGWLGTCAIDASCAADYQEVAAEEVWVEGSGDTPREALDACARAAVEREGGAEP